MTAPGCGRTVLIVEDDADTRLALAEVLRDVNYRPLHAANGSAALEELRAALPDWQLEPLAADAWPDETGATYEDNARIKARLASEGTANA